MKVWKRTRRVFKRSGDGASSFDLAFIVWKLSDGTPLQINVSLNSWKQPKPFYKWYVSVWTNEVKGNGWMSGKHANEWMLLDRAQVRALIARVSACRNKLTYLPWRQRKKILASWFKVCDKYAAQANNHK